MNKQRNVFYALVLFNVIYRRPVHRKFINKQGDDAIKISATPSVNPVLVRNENNHVLRIDVNIPAGNKDLNIVA